MTIKEQIEARFQPKPSHDHARTIIGGVAFVGFCADMLCMVRYGYDFSVLRDVPLAGLVLQAGPPIQRSLIPQSDSERGGMI